MKSLIASPDYKKWLIDLKSQIRQSQLKAAVKVNVELLRLYWNMGRDITTRELEAQWGSGFFGQLSRDLRKEFPDMDGFSVRNLKYIRQWFCFYSGSLTLTEKQANSDSRDTLRKFSDVNRQQAVADLLSIPWGHNILIITKCKNVTEALFYVRETLENGWSRNVLQNMISANLFAAKGKAITNFSRILPAPISDLAQQSLKDPYCFDFLSLRKNYDERELENALVANITQFLLELGSGFAYVGRQFRLEVGDEEFFLDLLFYHLKLRRYVVIELKTGKFKPEYLGKLGFYVTAVNQQIKSEADNDTIGLLICKDKDKITAEYSLAATNLPLGISEYEISRYLPEHFKSSLPTIEEIESELSNP